MHFLPKPLCPVQESADFQKRCTQTQLPGMRRDWSVAPDRHLLQAWRFRIEFFILCSHCVLQGVGDVWLPGKLYMNYIHTDHDYMVLRSIIFEGMLIAGLALATTFGKTPGGRLMLWHFPPNQTPSAHTTCSLLPGKSDLCDTEVFFLFLFLQCPGPCWLDWGMVTAVLLRCLLLLCSLYPPSSL